MLHKTFNSNQQVNNPYIILDINLALQVLKVPKISRQLTHEGSKKVVSPKQG